MNISQTCNPEVKPNANVVIGITTFAENGLPVHCVSSRLDPLGPPGRLIPDPRLELQLITSVLNSKLYLNFSICQDRYEYYDYMTIRFADTIKVRILASVHTSSTFLFLAESSGRVGFFFFDTKNLCHGKVKDLDAVCAWILDACLCAMRARFIAAAQPDSFAIFCM